ncbi:PTS sugar transporter subunit IIB [Oceanobacillus sojae]|uniref:PTS sugar transporter subunit IIB n=1 Tax=Oceanobacillus sojae TaxID=582851 RepID=UPI0021A58AA1|nr:PTS sugar transporter subunit IIB [Oceanobacillus sojae]MCT1901956.1 PTS sugar transporter subunit IIB [Oceanobacillus sojae]
MIVEIRLDERLVHGQTMTNWMSFFGATHVLVVNEATANDPLQVTALKMAVTGNYKLLVTNTKKAADILNDERSKNFKIYVLCKTPQDVLELTQLVPGIKEVNLASYGRIEKANIPNRKELVSGQLIVDDEDLQTLREIESSGIKCVMHVLPATQRTKLNISALKH